MIACSNCGAEGDSGQLVCENCGALLYNASVSTVLMRVDPTLLRLRRQREQMLDSNLPERTVVLHIRGLAERLSFEDGTEIILGRSDMQTANGDRLDLSRYGAHERGVSREHAMLRYKENELTVTDLKSVNGTTVNLTKVKPNQPHRLKNGDELMLGTLSIIVNFDSSGSLAKPPEDTVNKTLPINRRQLLQNTPEAQKTAEKSPDSGSGHGSVEASNSTQDEAV